MTTNTKARFNFAETIETLLGAIIIFSVCYGIFKFGQQTIQLKEAKKKVQVYEAEFGAIESFQE